MSAVKQTNNCTITSYSIILDKVEPFDRGLSFHKGQGITDTAIQRNLTFKLREYFFELKVLTQTPLFSSFFFLEDHPTHTHATTSSDGDGFGNVIVHEGCFKKSENPAKERTDPQNVNVVCINFCVQENINYAATISDRCLCLNNLPIEQLDEDQCSTPCPGKRAFQIFNPIYFKISEI